MIRMMVGALTILFVGLKLTEYIYWSWWIVLSPVIAWVTILILISAVMGVLIFMQKRNN